MHTCTYVETCIKKKLKQNILYNNCYNLGSMRHKYILALNMFWEDKVGEEQLQARYSSIEVQVFSSQLSDDLLIVLQLGPMEDGPQSKQTFLENIGNICLREELGSRNPTSLLSKCMLAIIYVSARGVAIKQ
ncbi:hypothetical protein ACJX0J_019232 [Zea mays]